MEIFNIFNTESRQTLMKSELESADSELESTDYSADSKANPGKVGVWVRAFTV